LFSRPADELLIYCCSTPDQSPAEGTTVIRLPAAIRYEALDNIEVWHQWLMPIASFIACSAGYVLPIRLDRDEVVPFNIILPTAAPTAAVNEFGA
jgi:hypothetical protein